MSTLLANKKARLNYEIGDKMTAGVELFGYEVKALRQGLGSLDGAYIIVRGGEAFLIGCYIPPYQQANTPKDYNERRNRVILLHKKEIAELAAAEQQKTNIIPLSFFTAGPKIKLEFGFGKTKKKFDKRQTLRKKDDEKRMRSSRS